MLSLLLTLACGEAEPDSSADLSDDSATTQDSEVQGEPCEGVTPEITELEPADLALMLESKDFRLLNVHVPYEGEIPGTDTHIEYTDIDALAADIGELDAKAVVYCKTGPMSLHSAKKLVERGYCNIYDLPAGMVGWENAGYQLAE